MTSDIQPKIYANMKKRILSLIDTMVKNNSHFEGMMKGLHVLPEEVEGYLHARRKALSSSSCRAQDTASTHLTWITYHQNIAQNAPLVDGIAWELCYQALALKYGVSVDAINCIDMGISADPAKSVIKIRGLKPMLTSDNKTRPEFVAYANAHAEEFGWDIAELHPPALALSLEEMNQFDDLIASVLSDMGVEGNTPTFLDVMMGGDIGEDVFLA